MLKTNVYVTRPEGDSYILMWQVELQRPWRDKLLSPQIVPRQKCIFLMSDALQNMLLFAKGFPVGLKLRSSLCCIVHRRQERE